MKKSFFLVLALMFIAHTMQAQTLHSQVIDATQRIHSFVAADQVSATGDQVNYVFDLSKKTSIQLYVISVTIDTVSIPAVTTSPYVTLYLKQSMDGSTYADIDTATFYGTAADTTFIWQDISTGVYYPYIKVELNGLDSIIIQNSNIIGNFLDK